MTLYGTGVRRAEFCDDSCCTCFLKVSSASATLVSSPTAVAPLSCRFAFNYSARHCSPGRTTSIGCQGTASSLALSQMWRPHGGHRETYHGPAPTSFAPLARRSRGLKLPFRSRSLGASQHLEASCAFVAYPPTSWLRAFARKLQSNHSGLHSGYSSTDSPSLSHHYNIIEFA
jgi:hypothetical protein